MNARSVVTVLAVFVTGTGLAILFVPNLTSITLVGGVTSAIGLFAIGLALIDATNARSAADPSPVPANPEQASVIETPGDDLDEQLWYANDQGLSLDRQRVSRRLTEVTRETLVVTGGLTESDARSRIEDGSWTDDPTARSFFGVSQTDDEEKESYGRQIRQALGRASAYREQVTAVVDELARRVGVGDGSARWPSVDDEDETSASPTGEHQTNQWRGVNAFGLAAIGVGVILEQPGLLLAGVGGLGLAGYANAGGQPDVDLAVERSVDEPSPTPGDLVEVTVTVRNRGGFLADLRMLDGVPDRLVVSDGSPRMGVSLRSGREATFRYTVVARRGTHEFDPLRVIARDLPGAFERDQHVDVEGASELTCVQPLHSSADPPLRKLAERLAGQVSIDAGGDGISFYGVREYRRGDPTNRIDWHRRARTGELTTLQFQEEHRTRVLVVVDTRPRSVRAPPDATTDSLDRAAMAAGRLFAALLDAGNHAGLAAMGPTDCWLAPGLGVEHRADAERLLGTHPAFLPGHGDAEFHSHTWLQTMRRRLGEDVQVLYLTPVCDGLSAVVARYLEGYGHPVTVISPDPTDPDTVGHRVAAIERHLRLTDLRAHDIPVVDWASDELLDEALLRAEQRH